MERERIELSGARIKSPPWKPFLRPTLPGGLDYLGFEPSEPSGLGPSHLPVSRHSGLGQSNASPVPQGARPSYGDGRTAIAAELLMNPIRSGRTVCSIRTLSLAPNLTISRR